MAEACVPLQLADDSPVDGIKLIDFFHLEMNS
jgi:hypothetical protein